MWLLVPCTTTLNSMYENVMVICYVFLHSRSEFRSDEIASLRL